jgi:hypothetical protein
MYCILSTPTSTWNHCFVVTEANSGKVYSQCLLDSKSISLVIVIVPYRFIAITKEVRTVT